MAGMPEQEDTTVADPSAPETKKDEEDSESEDLDLGIQASPEATEVLEDLVEDIKKGFILGKNRLYVLACRRRGTVKCFN